MYNRKCCVPGCGCVNSSEKENQMQKNRENADRERKIKKYQRKRKEKFRQEFTEKLSQDSQCSMSHIPVETTAGTSGTIQNVSDSLDRSQRKRKSNAEKQREYRQRLRNKYKLEELKLKMTAYSKAYRDRKKFEKFSKIESEILSQKSQNLILHRDVQVDPEAGTSGTIQNVPDSLEELQSINNIIDTNELHDFSDIHQTSTSADQMGSQADTIINKYKDYDTHVAARVLFHQQFTQNQFGYACKICDRLWFKNELKLVTEDFQDLFRQIIENYQGGSTVAVCSTCHVSIKKNKIPKLSKYNGFKYPDFPTFLPKLDIISERLISPRLPFMQIKRLRHYGQPGQYKIYGQIINVPIVVNNIVRNLPRDLDDEQSIYIHIHKKLIHKCNYLRSLVNKQNIKIWLRFLVDTPLYKKYGISINENFFNNVDTPSYNDINDVSEHIPIEETLTAQQQTLLWDEDKFLCILPGEANSSISLLFGEHAEELSFPAIYLGQFRKYKIKVTPFMQAISELRRADRRGVTPNHILYLAMKIIRIRVGDSLTIIFKQTNSSDNITKEQIMDTDCIITCLESNLAFLKCIPNSTWYWSSRKRDLLAMIRQLGKPTAFMTLSANEIKWISLLKILRKLKNSCDEISTEAIEQLHPMERSDLVNEDPVTCAIYFNKLVNVLMTILMLKRNSPFGKYFVVHYFKLIQFQHRGSPHAHIFLWLNNAPNDVLDKNYNEAIAVIDSLSTVSASEACGNMKINMHKHTDICYKKIKNQQYKKCRFEAPFMPSKQTVILSPMDKDDENYSTFRKQYASIRRNLESYSYADFDEFYNHNIITSDQHYYDIIRAGINRPRVFIKRLPTEKWHIPFNPFVFYLLQSNMDFQLILDEYSCAQYVVEYVNKSDRGISHLQKKIIQIMDEHPEFDIDEIIRKMSVKMLNIVEMSSQEAAWYLLEEPMSKSSTPVVYILTVPPHERKKIRKIMEELEKLDNESTDLWKENIFEKYEKRPEYLNDVSLSQFVSKYYKQIKTGQYVERKDPKIIRYRNYDMKEHFDEYRREMVTLHIPFKNEEEDILLDSKYINTYEENKDIIMEKRKEFESDLDIEKIMRICRQLYRDNDDLDDDSEVAGIIQEPDEHRHSMADLGAHPNLDLEKASLKSLGVIARWRKNLMPNLEFCEKVRLANEEQKEFLIHIVHHLLEDPDTPLQLFFTIPAGCGKTWTIRLALEIYNKFYGTDGYCNAYITCASTGKATVAIEEQTLHCSESNKPVNEGKTKNGAKISDDELILRRKRQKAATMRAYRERKRAFDPSSISNGLNENSGGTDTRTSDRPEPSTSAADCTNTTQQPAKEFLEIKQETIEKKCPSTSNEATENASKPSSSVDFTYDPLPIKKEVCGETGFDDINPEERVLLSIPEKKKPTPKAETHFLEVPIVALPTLAIVPDDNILLQMPKELDTYDKFMLSKAQDIKCLSNIDDRVTLVNNIERLVNVYINKDARLRRINLDPNVSGPSNALLSGPAAAVFSPEPININTIFGPSTSRTGKDKRKKI